ncbi:MAG TPA: SOS response-associated peptidase [Pseudonocardia sp.]|jgi:putative SOS response-associated peptidase YedK
MCGRYSSSRSDQLIADEFGVQATIGDQPPPSWNVAPTQTRRIIVERRSRGTDDPEVRRQLRSARWGLVPSWAKDVKIGNRLINARSETVTEKPAFKTAAGRRRCLIPADGYYEWEKVDGRKVPFFLHRDEEPLAFAGLYELWPDPARDGDDPDRWLWSYTVLTRPAPDSLGHIHDRCPVVVPADTREHWLDPALTDHDRVRELLGRIPDPGLDPREVSTAVNSTGNDSSELTAAVAG